jgi:hypothetical protein
MQSNIRLLYFLIHRLQRAEHFDNILNSLVNCHVWKQCSLIRTRCFTHVTRDVNETLCPETETSENRVQRLDRDLSPSPYAHDRAAPTSFQYNDVRPPRSATTTSFKNTNIRKKSYMKFFRKIESLLEQQYDTTLVTGLTNW